LWRHTIVEAIRNDPEWKNGDYRQQPRTCSRPVPIVAMLAGNPANQYKKCPTRAAADGCYQRMTAAAYQRADTNDRLYRYQASSDYDPAPELEEIRARLIALEFAGDQINSPQFSVLDRGIPRASRGRYVIIPAGEDPNGEAHDITNAKLWQGYLGELLRSSAN
jgi:homoserine O-acetyltransferase/O-succinyltransferase